MPIDLEHRFVARPGAHSLRSELIGLAALFAAGAMTGSLVLLAQAVRHGGIALGFIIAMGVLRIARRRGVALFDFGLEKLARVSEMFLGLGLVVAALWCVAKAPSLSAAFSREQPHTIALTAAVAAAWLLWTWRAERSRSWALPISLLACGALTLAALSGDRAIAMACDLFAGLALLALATLHGVLIFFDALREVADSPAEPEDLRMTLDCLYAAGIDRREVRHLRSRQVGNSLYLELHLDPRDDEPLKALNARIASARRAAAALPHWLDLSVKVVGD